MFSSVEVLKNVSKRICKIGNTPVIFEVMCEIYNAMREITVVMNLNKFFLN